MPDTIYLDHNSTTPLLPEVQEAMRACEQQGFANPSSQHSAGRRARKLLEDARDEIAQMLGANASPKPDRLLFTSGGTESNNLAISGRLSLQPAPGRIVASHLEHPSVLAPLAYWARRGWRLDLLPVGADGEVPSAAGNLPHSQPLPDPSLICLMLANHETGVLQPVAELGLSCHAENIPLHVDAVQAVGKIPVNFSALHAATLSFAPHKFHGPRGIGGLLVRHDHELSPQLRGGFQEAGLRPGTEPLPLVIGLQVALRIALRDIESRSRRLAALRDRLEQRLRSLWPSLAVNGSTAHRLSHVANVAFLGLDRRSLSVALDLAGIACSTGAACASGSSEPSPVLLAMGLDDRTVAGSLRFSLGATTTADDIDEAARRMEQVLRQAESAARRHARGSSVTTGLSG